MTEYPVYPASEHHSAQSAGAKKRLALIVGAGLLGLGAAALLIPYGFQAFSHDVPAAKALAPVAEQFYAQAPAAAVEGQPTTLMLGWRDLPHGSQVSGADLTLRWQDLSYQGKPLQQRLALHLGPSSQRQDVVFQSPGLHRLEVLGPDQSVWKRLEVQVKPYPATVFPAHWEQNQTLAKSPEHYHIWVNLEFDPKRPQQRQYLQITEDGQILERLLISSGAMAGSTPMGEYDLGFKDFYPRSHKYNDAPMPFWSAINVPGHPGEVGFHSLEDGGYAWLLGRPASHGCIRMSKLPSVETNAKGQKYWGDRGGARWIFDRVPQKTPVSIFKAKVSDFAYEDYERYLARQYREAVQTAKAKKQKKTV